MPWKNASLPMQRLEFIKFASQPGVNVRELCRRYGLSPTTAYKWLSRHREQGEHGLSDRSRRPKSSPGQTSRELERMVVATHRRFPDWGPRKLRRVLQDEGYAIVPAPNTITAILQRHGCEVRTVTTEQPPYRRFTHPEPNVLWQMDFKGHFALRAGRCHPLTVLDDHSRFALCLQACPAENRSLVQPIMEQTFRRFGLPERILCDNAGPWGTPDPRARFTGFGVWLLRLGVDITHGRPFHPQTQGKCERFHRSFKAEVLNRSTIWRDLAHCQSHFDDWRQRYNHVRPHHSLEMDTPAAHYRLSPRSLPPTLPPIEYLPDDVIRIVKSKGEITFRNHFFFIGQAFIGLPVALRATLPDGRFDVFFAWKKIGVVDFSSPLKTKFLYNPLLP